MAREGLSEQVALELRPEGGGGASPFPIRGGALAAAASGLQAQLCAPARSSLASWQVCLLQEGIKAH